MNTNFSSTIQFITFWQAMFGYTPSDAFLMSVLTRSFPGVTINPEESDHDWDELYNQYCDKESVLDYAY